MGKSFFTRKVVSALLGMCLMGMAAVCQAYVDDARIMDSFNEDNEMIMYDYLNQNDFRFYNKVNQTDAYIKKDNSMFMALSNVVGMTPFFWEAGQMNYLIFLKNGYTTNKGIHVGSKLQDVLNAYGSVYKPNRTDIYTNDPNTGYFNEGSHSYETNYGMKREFKYYNLTYYDRNRHWLQILVDKSDKKVKAISYAYGSPRFGESQVNDLPSTLYSWGLYRHILPVKDNPLKNLWTDIENIFH